MRSCTVLASQSVALRAVLCSQVVNFEDPALDALFDEVSRHELLFCVHCCAVFIQKVAKEAACLPRDVHPNMLRHLLGLTLLEYCTV